MRYERRSVLRIEGAAMSALLDPLVYISSSRTILLSKGPLLCAAVTDKREH